MFSRQDIRFCFNSQSGPAVPFASHRQGLVEREIGKVKLSLKVLRTSSFKLTSLEYGYLFDKVSHYLNSQDISFDIESCSSLSVLDAMHGSFKTQPNYLEDSGSDNSNLCKKNLAGR